MSPDRTPPADDRLRHALREVRSARLRPEDWHRVDEVLARLQRGDDVVDELNTLLFEAKVESRFSGGRANASLPPTKQTSVLPIVGLACAALLVGVGTLLGGGVILWGVFGLGAFVFGVAFAGSRVAHRSTGDDAEPPAAAPEPIPPQVTQRVLELEPSDR